MFKDISKGKKIFYVILWFLPLVLAIVWLVYIRVTKTRGVEGTFLSPINNTPLIIALIIFVVGYLLFLFMLFFSDIKEMILATRKRSVKQK